MEEASLAFTDSIDSLATRSIFGGISENGSTALSCNNYEINKKYLHDQNNTGVLHEDLQGTFPTPSVVDQLPTTETARFDSQRSGQSPLPSTPSSAKYDASVKHDSSSKVNSNKNPVIQLIRSKSKRIIVQLDDEQSDDENSIIQNKTSSSKKEMEGSSKLVVKEIQSNLEYRDTNSPTHVENMAVTTQQSFINESENYMHHSPSPSPFSMAKTITVRVNQSPNNSTKGNSALALSPSFHSSSYSTKNFFALNDKTANYSNDDKHLVSSVLPPLRTTSSPPKRVEGDVKKNVSTSNRDSFNICVVSGSAIGSNSSKPNISNNNGSSSFSTSNITKLARFKTRCSLCRNKGLTYCFDCNRVFCSSCWISIEQYTNTTSHTDIGTQSPTHQQYHHPKQQSHSKKQQQQSGGGMNFIYHPHEGGILSKSGGAIVDTIVIPPPSSSSSSSLLPIPVNNKKKGQYFTPQSSLNEFSMNALSSKSIAMVADDINNDNEGNSIWDDSHNSDSIHNNDTHTNDDNHHSSNNNNARSIHDNSHDGNDTIYNYNNNENIHNRNHLDPVQTKTSLSVYETDNDDFTMASSSLYTQHDEHHREISPTSSSSSSSLLLLAPSINNTTFAQYVSEKRNTLKLKSFSSHHNSSPNNDNRVISTSVSVDLLPRNEKVISTIATSNIHNCHHDAFVESIIHEQNHQKAMTKQWHQQNYEEDSTTTLDSNPHTIIPSIITSSSSSSSAHEEHSVSGFLSSVTRSYEMDKIKKDHNRHNNYNHGDHNDDDDDSVVFIRSTVLPIHQQSSSSSSSLQGVYIHDKIPINLNDAIQKDIWPIHNDDITIGKDKYDVTQNHTPTVTTTRNNSKLRKPTYILRTPLTRMTNHELKVLATPMINLYHNNSSHNDQPLTYKHNMNNNNNNNSDYINKQQQQQQQQQSESFHISTDEAQFQKYMKLKKSMEQMRLIQQHAKYTVLPFDSFDNHNNNNNSNNNDNDKQNSNNNNHNTTTTITSIRNGSSNKLFANTTPLSLNGANFVGLNIVKSDTSCVVTTDKKDIHTRGKVSNVNQVVLNPSSLRSSSSLQSSSSLSLSSSALPSSSNSIVTATTTTTTTTKDHQHKHKSSKSLSAQSAVITFETLVNGH